MRHGLLPTAATSLLALAWASQSYAQETLTLWHNGSCPAGTCLALSVTDDPQPIGRGEVFPTEERRHE